MNMRRATFSLLFALLCAALPAHSQILRLPRFITVQAQAQAGQSEAKPDHHITAEEQNELLASIDSILKFDSADTDLPQKQSIKKQFVTRDQVQAFIEKRMKDDQDAQRLQRSEIVLKKFGLLPADFKLQEFLVELLREQVAGYYDPDTKTVYLLDWLEPEQQKPVMAHELTHALQDQNFGLKKWLRDDPKDHDSAQAEVSSDEQTAARSAVVEGQAMAVMLDYLLEPAGQSVLNAPRIVDAIEAGMESGNGTPVFSGAPLYLKQLLLFPYTYGLDFTRDMLQRGGKKRAFAEVFKKPPQNTRQIMQPNAYVSGEDLSSTIKVRGAACLWLWHCKTVKSQSLAVPELTEAFGDRYERYDVGSIGQFDVNILIRTYGKKGENDKLAEAWRGGWYYAVKPKSGATSDIGLVYVSRWADEAAARQFAQIYAGYLPSRYPGSSPAGDNAWQTSQGPASVRQEGASVVVMESLDASAAARVREAVDKGLSAK